MRKTLLSFAVGAVLAIAGNLVLAQSDTNAPPPPGSWHGPRNPAEQAEHLAKRLGLTSAQQAQVQTILTNQQTEMQALNQNQSITHQQWLAQMKSVHEATESKIEALLNDTQKQEYQQMREHMRHGPPPPDAPPPQD